MPTCAKVDELIDDAGREIAAQVATDVLIIEDEPMIAMDLESMVEGLGHRVIGVARTHSEAVEGGRPTQARAWCSPTSSSPTAARASTPSTRSCDSFEVPVIFITAYPERLLTGERPEPAFLITKPFQPDTVKAIISQALFFERRAHLRDRPQCARSVSQIIEAICPAFAGHTISPPAKKLKSWPRHARP